MRTKSLLHAVGMLFHSHANNIILCSSSMGAVECGDIAYFFFGTSPCILARHRLTPTTSGWHRLFSDRPWFRQRIRGGPRAECWYLAYGQAVKRYDLAGSNEVHLINSAESVQANFYDGNVILLNRSVSSMPALRVLANPTMR